MVIPDHNGRTSLSRGRGEVKRDHPRLFGHEIDLHSVDGVASRVWLEGNPKSGKTAQAFNGQIHAPRLLALDGGVVQRVPPGEGGDEADNGFFPDLHRAADPAFLKVTGAYQVSASGDDPSGQAAEELVCAVEDEIRPLAEEAAQVIL